MQIKICPGCGAEYFAHIDECSDCNLPLKTEEEINQEEAEKERFLDLAGGEVVAVREAKGPLLKEFRKVLLDAGIASFINMTPGCKPGSCGSTSLLFVAQEHAEAADSFLNEYHMKMHPDAESHSEGESGACPACGYPAGEAARECPDCGLLLDV